MDPLGSQPLPQATTLWYNYGSYNELLANQPLQLQVAVPAVHMVGASPQAATPAPSEVEDLQPVELGGVNAIPPKSKKNKKNPTEMQERNFHCDQCGSSFTNTSNLRSHMRIHSGVRPYVCELCGKSFIQSSNLKAHKRIHTGERPYQCSECGQTFSRSSHLVGHKRTHTGERPYICGICGEAFFTSSHLRNHVRRHTGEKPYTCEYCGEAFGQSVELRVHLRYHTGEKPFKCRECETAFVSAKELKSHRKVHHIGSKPFNCEQCDRAFRTQTFLMKHKLQCKGPREKRPKGRPRKYPRADGEEPPWKKGKKRKTRIPAVPTDRVSRSRTRAITDAKLKEETVGEKQQHSDNKAGAAPQHADTKRTESRSERQVNGGVQLSPLELKAEVELEERIPELPMVEVMLNNLGEPDVDAPNMVLPASHTLQQVKGDMGVMDLSGQHLPETQVHHEMDLIPQALSLSNTSQHQQIQVVRNQHQLPTVLNATESQQILSSHHHMPVVNAHQVSVDNVPHQTVMNSDQLPVLNAHQNSTQHLTVVSAHQPGSHCHTTIHPPLVNAHQQPSANSLPMVLSAAQHIPNDGVVTHTQVPIVSAHQSVAMHSGHKTGSLGPADASAVLYEAGQPYVVDLSNPALASQVSLINQPIASPQYTRP